MPLPPYMGDAVAVSWLLIILLAVVSFLGTRKMREKPCGLQNLLEMAVEALGKIAKSVIGPEGDKFLPLIATLFIYIFVMGVFGLIPGFVSPVASLNMTGALALVVFSATHYHGMKHRGALKYLRHLMGEPLWLAPLMLPIHLIMELVARPVSLAVRLFVNIFADDMMILQLAILFSVTSGVLLKHPSLGGWILNVSLSAFSGVLQVLVMAFAVFVAAVQALIFSVLASAYIGMAIAEEEG